MTAVKGLTTEITLDHPFEYAGSQITKLSMRRPKNNDTLRQSSRTKTGMTDDDVQFHLFADLCSVEVELIYQVDTEDNIKIVEAYEAFLPKLMARLKAQQT